MKATLAQTRMELTLTARRGEGVLVLVGIPLGILLFFGATGLFGVDVNLLVPGLFSLAILSAAFTSLAISTGFERKYFVLKRLGATPLPRSALIVAKATAVFVIEVFQVLLLLGTAVLLFHWRADIDVPLFILAMILGTLAFAGLGLFIAGTLRAEATLAVANGLYLLMLLLGDIIVPIWVMPPAFIIVAKVLPVAPLTGLFRAAVGQGPFVMTDLASVVFWAVLGPALAALLFRWEEK